MAETSENASHNAEALAREVVERLRGAGFLAYFAGGCVRDRLLGLQPLDYDVATSALPERVLGIFEKAALTGARFGTVTVVSPRRGTVEVTTFRREGAYRDGRHPDDVCFTEDPCQDARRRDFTVNGMFYDPENDEVLDFVEGRMDLARRILRAIGDPARRFREDRLRLVRAARFSAWIDFTVEETTRRAARELAPLVVSVAPERIAVELEKGLLHGERARFVRALDDLGLLVHLLPEVVALKGVGQSERYHPEGDVFTHTLLALDKLESPSLALVLATLLHDVGKPPAAREHPGHFYHHERVGAEITRAICRRLRLSNDITDGCTWLVRNHMRLVNARRMRLGRLKRLMAEPHFDDLVRLLRADALASDGDLTDYDFICQMRGRFAEEEIKPRPLVTGHDLVAMGLEPGPAFRDLLEQAYNSQLEDEIATRDEALALLRARAGEMGLFEND